MSDSAHFLIVGEEGASWSWDLHHPESCERAVSENPDHYGPTFTCAISYQGYEWGLPERTQIDKPGIYMLEYWATPSSTAGGIVQDADDGIEVTELCDALLLSGMGNRLAVAEEAAEMWRKEAKGESQYLLDPPKENGVNK